MSFSPDDTPEFIARVTARREARMRRVDDMPAGLRALVHEYGLTIVSAYLDCGVKSPKHIRHLVETVLDEFSPSRGTGSNQGIRAARGVAP